MKVKISNRTRHGIDPARSCAPVVSRVVNRGKQRQDVRGKHAGNLVYTEAQQNMFFHRTSKHPATILVALLAALLVTLKSCG